MNSATGRDAIVARHEDLVTLSHFIHSHPELGYQEFESSAAVAKLAEECGFDVQRGVAGRETAFVARRGSGSLHLALCAEFDALPDVGHACGHNIIAASSLGAAIGLAEVADDFDLTVSLFGTPSEEGGGGKIDLIEGGHFRDVHAAMMIHPWPEDRLRAQCLAVDHLEVIYEGREAHASAAPWEGVNASDALTLAHVAVGLLRQQLPPGDQIHGITVSGGSAANIIPGRTVANFMARSINVDRLRALRVRLDACFEAGALATGSKLRIAQLGHTFSHMEDDLDILAHYRKSAESIGRQFSHDDAGSPVPTISTDMANVSLEVPSIHPLLGIPTHGAVNHQPAFTDACKSATADAAVLDGAMALYLTGVGVATDERLRARLRARRHEG